MISSADLLRTAKTSDASECFCAADSQPAVPKRPSAAAAPRPLSSRHRLRARPIPRTPPRSFPATLATYRHDPYAFNALEAADVDLGRRSCASLYAADPSARCGLVVGPVPPASESADEAVEGKAALLELSGSSAGEDGVSEVGSEAGVGVGVGVGVGAAVVGSPPPSAASRGADGFVFRFPRPAVFRYASVNFRFGSAWFIAPFRTQPGDMVVAEYPLNQNMHMGIVNAITTVKPATFHTEANDDANYLTDEEMQTLPRLIRHARDHDKDTKLEMRRYDLHSLENARRIAEEMRAPVTFLDAEWLMGMNVITFLVHVYGDVAKVDEVADELARVELAEVVFTYPAANTEVS